MNNNQRKRLFELGIGPRPDDEDKFTCICGWNGKVKDMVKKSFYRPFDCTRSGREGETYHCPNCGEELGMYIWKMS